MVMPGVIGCIAEGGVTPPGSGPTGVSVATSAAGNYDEAFLCYRVGTAAQVFETGSNFSSGVGSATIPYSDFGSDRDRSIAWGCYCRATTSGGSMTYAWNLVEDSAFPTATLQYGPPYYNANQDNITVDVPAPPSGQPDPLTGIGPFLLFTSPPSLSDAGTYTIKCTVTDDNGSTTSDEIEVTMTFG